MSHKKVLYRKRDFLNKEEYHSLAAIFGEIVAEWNNIEDMENGKPPTNEKITFNISDCVRKIDIQFDTKNANEIQNSLEKISKLSYFVNSFKDQLYKLANMIEERNELKETNNLTDKIYEDIDKLDITFDLERNDNGDFIVLVYNEIYDENTSNIFYNQIQSKLKTLEKKYNTKIELYINDYNNKNEIT